MLSYWPEFVRYAQQLPQVHPIIIRFNHLIQSSNLIQSSDLLVLSEFVLLRFYLLLFAHAAVVPVLPVELPDLLGLPEAACRAHAFLHMERHPAASSAAYVFDPDFLAERRCTLCHFPSLELTITRDCILLRLHLKYSLVFRGFIFRSVCFLIFKS